jgi:ABC-type lipoprotein export system ATPase subunit
MLRVAGVSKRFPRGAEEFLALADVDLEVDEGEFVALVGRSGSGKSTLLHLAGGLDRPDTGTVELDGRDLATMSVGDRARLRRRDIGFVFQFFHLIPTLSVRENVELPLLLDGAKANGRVDELLERVAIAHRSDHLPAELSGGELQRAAVARALVAQPRLVLADEPTGNLDSVNGEAILELLLEQVAVEGAALVLVTHDADAAARAPRRHTLRDGRLEPS